MKIHSHYFIFLIFCFPVFFSLHLYAQGKQVRITCVAFYNLENLFDTIRDPRINDEEFTPSGPSRWDTKKYNTKLAHLAEAISRIGNEYTKGGPVMMGVSEVENRQVVEDLIHTPPLAAEGFRIVHYDSPDRRGIDVAFLYQPAYFEVKSSSVHPLRMPSDTGFRTRDVLQVDGILDGDLVHVLVNHWPSRSSGEKETAPKRNAAADLCRSIVQSIYKNDPAARIIIMGDLNDDPVDESLIKHLGITSKPENVKTGDLFDPMWQMYRNGTGSLAYKDTWNLFDQIIVSSAFMDKTNPGWHFFKAGVLNEKFLLQKEGPYSGYPFRTYAGGIYMGGYSDHLPVYIFLAKEVK